MKPSVSDYTIFKELLVEEFEKASDPEDEIHRAFNATFDLGNLCFSFRKMKPAF